MTNEQPKFNIGDNVVWCKDFDAEFEDCVLCTVVDVRCSNEGEITYTLADDEGAVIENVREYLFAKEEYEKIKKDTKHQERVYTFVEVIFSFIACALVVADFVVMLLLKNVSGASFHILFIVYMCITVMLPILIALWLKIEELLE